MLKIQNYLLLSLVIQGSFFGAQASQPPSEERTGDKVVRAAQTLNDHHDDIISAVAFNSDGTQFASADVYGVIKVANPMNGTILHRFESNSGAITALVFSLDGTRLFSEARNKSVKVWSLIDSRFLCELKMDSEGIHGLVFNKNGTELATIHGLNRDTIKIWNPNDSELLREFPVVYNSRVIRSINSVVFSPNGKQLAVGSDAKTGVFLLNSLNGVVNKVLDDNKGSIGAIAFSPLGTQLIAAPKIFSGLITLFDVNTNEVIKELQYDNSQSITNTVAFSPDGFTVIAIPRRVGKPVIDIFKIPTIRTYKESKPDPRLVAAVKASFGRTV